MAKPANDALAVEHEVQRYMLQRLGIEWTPGEPFYSLIEAEIERLRTALAEISEHCAYCCLDAKAMADEALTKHD